VVQVPAAQVLVGWTGRRDVHDLAANLAAQLLGHHPGPLHHTCPGCGSIKHGRPSFDAPVHVSVAHTAALSLVAVSRAGRVGVDLELHGVDRTWVRSEALAKAHGVGLVRPVPRDVPAYEVELEVPGHRAVLVILTDRAPDVAIRTGASEAPAG
jgi:hypothetical protein